MPTNRTAAKFGPILEIRHRLLDIAAGLDRIDRADDAAKARSDGSYLQLEQAIRVLVDGKPDRAERIQMTFSLAYDEKWPSVLGIN
jgi:hypothetical protein